MKPNWKRDGMKSNGLYNKQPKSPLTDTPEIGEYRLEAIKSYIIKYVKDKGRQPTASHLNKQFALRATKQFYMGIQ